MFRLVIFDWDGTLANSRSAVVMSFQSVFRSIGCFVSDQFIERRMGIGTILTFKEALILNNIAFTPEMLEHLEKQKLIQFLLVANDGLLPCFLVLPPLRVYRQELGR